MIKLTVNNYYDDQTLEHIGTKFYIDGESANFEEYIEYVQALGEIDDDIVVDEDENIYEQDDSCDCPNCTILKYVERIVEITGGCPGCIGEILNDFMVDIIDHVVIEDENEEMSPLN